MLSFFPSLLSVTNAFSNDACPGKPEDCAKAMLAKMSLAEKTSMLVGIKGTYVGNVAGIDHLGIPPQNMNDGNNDYSACQIQVLGLFVFVESILHVSIRTTRVQRWRIHPMAQWPFYGIYMGP